LLTLNAPIQISKCTSRCACTLRWESMG